MSNGSNRYQQPRQPQDPNRPIELLLRQPYYDMIDQGIKTIEGRVAYHWLNRAKEGGKVDFKRGQQDSRLIRCGIDWVLRAANFEEALIEVEWQKAIPNVNTFDEALAIYDRIYPPEKVQEIGGVVLLGFTKEGVVNV
jgi:ASC-1-like (ASCH) protein